MADREYVIRYDTANVPPSIASLRDLKSALLGVDDAAVKSQKSLLDVGKATAAISRTDSKARKLASDLDAVTQAADSATTALGKVGANLQGMPATITRTTGSLTDLAIAYKAISLAQQGLTAFLSASKENEEMWKRRVDLATKYRDTLREIANLEDKTGPNNDIVADTLSLGVAAGATPAQAQQFRQSFLNIAPTARARGAFGKDGSPEAAELEKQVLVESLRTARRMGVDEGTMGESIGTAAMFGGFTDVESAMGSLGGAMRGLSLGKVPYSEGARSLNKLAAKLIDPVAAGEEGAAPGRIANYAEGGAYLGALSLGTGSADQAYHRGVQISRVLNTTNADAARELAAMGVRPGDTDPQKLIALDEGLKAAGVKDRISWMAERGIGSEATREAVVAGMKVSDVIRTSIAEVTAPGLGASFIADNGKFVATDMSALAAANESQKQAIEMARGMEREPFERAKELAENRLKAADPNYNSTWDSLLKGIYSIPVYALAGVSSSEEQKESDSRFGAIPTLVAAGRLVGVDIEAEYPDLFHKNSIISDPGLRANAFARAAARLQGLGVDPYGKAGAQAMAMEVVNGARSIGANAGPIEASGGVSVNVNDQGLKQGAAALMQGAEALKKAADRMGGRGLPGLGGGPINGKPGAGAVIPGRGLGGK